MLLFSPFCVNKLIAQLKVIFTPVFTAHSSPLPFIHSVNIGTTDERGGGGRVIQILLQLERAVEGSLCRYTIMVHGWKRSTSTNFPKTAARIGDLVALTM